MTDDNNPDRGTVEPSVTDALADLLDEPEDDEPENDEQDGKADGKKPEADDAEDEPDEGEESEDSDEDEPDEKGDGPKEYSGGKFAADNARVKLSDGSTVTIAELKEGTLRQSDYTRKTQAVAEERKRFEVEREGFNQLQQQTREQHALVQAWLDRSKPQRPTAGYAEDPLAHGEYNDQMGLWNENKTYWDNQIKQWSETQKAEQDKNFRAYLEKEQSALVERIPAFRDTGKRDAFVKEAVRAYSDLGIKEDEIRGLTDHRMISILLDAVRYRRAKAKAPAVQKALDGTRRTIVRGGKRQNPRQAQQRDRLQRTERLKQSGSLDDGIRALKDMDL